MILMPLPHYGFDPTESAVPWEYLTNQGIEIIFATPDGKIAAADNRLLTGEGFGPFKKLLMAGLEAVEAYHKMIESEAFRSPISYFEINPKDYAGILLPGGHDKGMKQYLESSVLQEKIVSFFRMNKIVGAICHGVVVAARSIDPQTKKSVIHDHQTTSLLKSQEMGAYYLTALWLKDYYRTYQLSVEAEVKSVLDDPHQFQSGRLSLRRDSLSDDTPALVVQDRNYLSARWPGDAYTFAKSYYRRLMDNE